MYLLCCSAHNGSRLTYENYFHLLCYLRLRSHWQPSTLVQVRCTYSHIRNQINLLVNAYHLWRRFIAFNFSSYVAQISSLTLIFALMFVVSERVNSSLFPRLCISKETEVFTMSFSSILFWEFWLIHHLTGNDVSLKGLKNQTTDYRTNEQPRHTKCSSSLSTALAIKSLNA